MSTAIHTLHVVLAGVWLGGVLFTTLVVSPALKAMKWSEAERCTESAEEARAFVEKRRSLQRLSLGVSWVNVLISVAVAALAVGA